MESGSKRTTLPTILDGKYYKVLSTDKDGKVKAQCMPCDSEDKNTVVSGSVHPTSNFTSHLKVS